MIFIKSTKHCIEIQINLSKKKQVFSGWGTSLCWWANCIGRWKNQQAIDTICKLLFSVEDGLGINVLRYNMGAGENPPNKANLRLGADMPCCYPESRNWEWENDAAQIGILLRAKEYGANIFEFFVNSPPLWMLVSNSTAGSKSGLSNLREDMYDEFANYVVEFIEQFQIRYKVPIDSLAPFNEPISFWWKSDNDQEGCYFDTKQQSFLLEKIWNLIVEKNLKVKISAPDCWSTFETIYNYNCYPANVRSYVSQINTHTYFTNKQSRIELQKIANSENKPIWMSEVTCGGEADHNHNDLTSAFELCNNIFTTLNEMEAVGWVYWQAVENELLDHNHGLIKANFEGPEKYFLTKQYFAFANFSKFLRPGFIILSTNRDDVIVAFDNEKNQLVIVCANAFDTPQDLAIHLPDNKTNKKIKMYRTSANENLALVECDTLDNIVLNARSIQTILIEL